MKNDKTRWRNNIEYIGIGVLLGVIIVLIFNRVAEAAPTTPAARQVCKTTNAQDFCVNGALSIKTVTVRWLPSTRFKDTYGYRLYWRIKGVGNWRRVLDINKAKSPWFNQTNPSAVLKNPVKSFPGLVDGASLCMRVSAYDSTGESPKSPPICVPVP